MGIKKQRGGSPHTSKKLNELSYSLVGVSLVGVALWEESYVWNVPALGE